MFTCPVAARSARSALEGDPMAVGFSPDPYDPEGAKKLLAEAGYPKGFHGGKFYPYQGGYWPYGEQIANYWKAIGITVDTVLLDRPAWFANRQGGKMKGGIFIDNSQAPTIGATPALPFRLHLLRELSGHSGVMGSIPAGGLAQRTQGNARSASRSSSTTRPCSFPSPRQIRPPPLVPG